jgi:polygalacturonase
MKNTNTLLLLALVTSASCASKNGAPADPPAPAPRHYPLRDFGAIDSRVAYSTDAIQLAILQASAAGGGRVYVPPGTYLTAPIRLHSGVELHLETGATLLGSPDRSKYNIPATRDYNLPGERALLWADSATNIAITGQGTIDGQGEAVAEHAGRLIAAGQLADRNAAAIKQWVEAGNTKFLRESPRPQEENRPMLIALYNSRGVTIQDITITNGAAWVTTLWRCDDAKLLRLTIRSRAFWNNDGIDLVDCTNTLVSHCDVNSADDGICLKSQTPGLLCDRVTIENCTVCSSASAIKFGTASTGGFTNITIRDITVRDTYRSAIAIESVDGGTASNITVANINATNTANAIFLVAGTRGGHSTASNITFDNITCQIPATKPDANAGNYTVPDRPRNPYPALVTGSPSSFITNVVIRDLRVTTAGGGSTAIANATVADIPAMDTKYNRYPEYDMFGEMPAWGLFARNINNLTLENIHLQQQQEDYRHPVIIDNVTALTLATLTVLNERKTPLLLGNAPAPTLANITAPLNQSGKEYHVYAPE